jgi:hypothetical protein
MMRLPWEGAELRVRQDALQVFPELSAGQCCWQALSQDDACSLVHRLGDLHLCDFMELDDGRWDVSADARELGQAEYRQEQQDPTCSE